MYNHYMDGTFAPLSHPAASAKAPQKAPHRKAPVSHQSTLPDGIGGSLSKLLGGLGKHGSISQLDTGDILLVLILLFLFLEGDNLELVITLGLVLLFGFGED